MVLFGAKCIALAPLPKAEDHGEEVPASLRQLVLTARAAVVEGPVQDTPVHKEPEAIRKDVLCHPERPLIFGETTLAVQGVPDDQQAPLVPHKIGGAGNRALRVGPLDITWLQHETILP